MRALLQKIRQLLRDRRFRRIWYRSVSSIAALVVFVTTYALVLPAITMESQAACGMEAHQHDDSCYEKRLTCGQEESRGHHHNDSCYSVAQELVCRQEEHQHSPSCYDADGNLVCSTEEHEHGSDCYQENRELTCGLEESEGHTHTEACYEKVLVCGKEAHIHNTECYREDSTAVAASTGSTADGYANTGDAADSTEVSTAAMTTDVLTDSMESESLSDGYVPTLDSVNVNAILNKHTGFYYFHVEDGQEIPADSSAITDWKKVGSRTELASEDLVKAYFAYSIPAGALNETNQISRYRLPANLHLTDDQIIAINENVNGIAAGFVEPDTGRILDEDYDNYRKYLGAEAVEGTRTPDKQVRDGVQEYISAVVKAENVYENTLDENGRYVDAGGNITDGPGVCIGQDLIFIFTPYTIEKNQVTYDQDGKPVTAGEKVTGWFACDFNMDQIDWVENETDLDNSSLEKTAEVIFTSADKDLKTKEISETLKMTETAESGKTANIAAGKDAATAADEKEEIMKAGTLTADGSDYRITLDYTAEAKVPEGASLSVREITTETDKEAYEACMEQAAQKLASDDRTNVDRNATRFFDIEIVTVDEDGKTTKIEPAAPVSVRIQFTEKQLRRQLPMPRSRTLPFCTLWKKVLRPSTLTSRKT